MKGFFLAEQIKDILIVGGGSSGWMTAALMARLLGQQYRIRLVESDAIATIGVGEATIPAIKTYNSLLGLDEKQFVQATQGSFKLGIQFDNWGAVGDSYLHGFGTIGKKWGWLNFYQYWLKMQALGKASHMDNFSINTKMALLNKFMRADGARPSSPLSEIAFAYHFDAGLYAKFLRDYSEERGVERLEGKVVSVNQHSETGFIKSVLLENGDELSADFFIDCTGLRALLIEDTLETGFEDWSHWLPCDRAIALPSEKMPDIAPYTRSTALTAGWQWRIPLQHRTGNGHVYASEFLKDDAAETMLRDGLETAAIADPRLIRFKTGKRKKFWNKNCVAIGLSSGFLEPLESTSLYLVQTAVTRLVSLFPDKGFDPANTEQFNRQSDFEIERIRDFVIAHYKATEREDTPFWKYCKNMDVPDTLREKLDVFKAYGRVERVADELFREESWVQVLIGQRHMPKAYDPLVDIQSEEEIAAFIANVESVIDRCVAGMPSQTEFIARTCAAPMPN
ncbi:MAG: tryptophan 7-halogenase [Kordiimonadaceae bacterium]|nr:tryptophan 7-halogenase [Kordiimonadaceae bacterium]